MNLDDPVEKLPGAGGALYAKKFHQLGIKTIRNLLWHFPHRYEDFSDVVFIRDVELNKNLTIRGTIQKISNIRAYRKKINITECFVEDETGSIKAVWFNQPFLLNTLKPGRIVNLSGKLSLREKEYYLSNPAYEIIGREGKEGKFETNHTGRLVPMYPETRGLTSRRLRYLIRKILFLAEKISEYLPEKIRNNQRLLPLADAIRHIHFPRSRETAEKAKKRLAFDELFLMQLLFLRAKMKRKQERANAIPLALEVMQEFVKSLPFSLTQAQKRAAWQIIQDIAKPRPMNRLLEGDVGSGKTVVAAMACLSAAANGFQTAFLAPTEILAQQHYEKISRLLKPFNANVALLTGSVSTSRAKKILAQVNAGTIQILIGTHSLLQERVTFNKLALAVIDEQHRFGVEQRASLLKEGTPHFLSMTATPIPRTLALALYGDLDISVLDEMPKGRQKIVTKIVSPAKREAAYQFIRKQIKSGRQTFVICPRIESNTLISLPRDLAKPNKTFQQRLLTAEVKTVKEEYKKLSEQIFPDLKVGMLHGKLKPKEKERVMKQFNAGIVDILVSTSVVEVGVDVPNASVMMIEGAELFGLAQLHQFRGRVGRADHQSYCLLFTDSSDKAAHKRLQALSACEDGFALAEKDLALRGPGDFYGSRQWGLPDFVMASLADLPLIQAARTEAADLLREDPRLNSCPLLKEKLSAFKEKIHFE